MTPNLYSEEMVKAVVAERQAGAEQQRMLKLAAESRIAVQPARTLARVRQMATTVISARA